MEVLKKGTAIEDTTHNYLSPFDKFKDILKDVQQLQREDGGVIWIGVEEGSCVGCRMSSEQSWLALMNKLDKFLRITDKDLEIKYSYFLVDDSYYATKIEVAKSTPIEKELTGRNYSHEEDETVELKLSFNFMQSKDGIAKYISAFANTNGGKIMVGVADDGKIVGVDIRSQVEWDKIKLALINTRFRISDKMFISEVGIEKYILPNKRFVAEITIPKHKGDAIYAKDNEGNWNKWIRVSSSCIKVDQLILQSQKKFSQMEHKLIEMNANYELIYEKYKKYKKCAIHIDEECGKKVKELAAIKEENANKDQVVINLEMENVFYKEKTAIMDAYIGNIVGKYEIKVSRCDYMYLMLTVIFLGLIFMHNVAIY